MHPATSSVGAVMGQVETKDCVSLEDEQEKGIKNLNKNLLMEETGSINFSVNGVVFTVENPDIGTTLNSWLRNNAKLTGTKAMCKEGGCGSCVVMVTRSDPVSGKDVNTAVNSCLFPLLSVDGCHVITTEGLVTNGGQYNDIQKRIAHFNATQCGYCTPGFVMTMYSLLQKNPNPTQEEIEGEFDGNICRCTGFRSILDAMKSFATNADPKLKQICSDIEDLNVCHSDKSKCKNNGVDCRNSCGRYRADGTTSQLHKDEKNWTQVVLPRPIKLINSKTGSTSQWLRPGSLSELTDAVKNNADKKLRFVVGNTSTGVFKYEEPFDVYVDTKLVPDLYQINNGENTLTVGANVSLNNLIATLQQHASESVTFDVMAKHIKKIANVPVRNVGSWIGNLTMKRLHPEFPSDMFTLFEAYSVKLQILDCSTGNQKTYDLIGDEGFINLDMSGKVVLSATIPKVASTSNGTQHALSYKVMPRSQNAHAYVNAAFYAAVDGQKISKPSLVFGGISKTFFHATQTEQYLLNKTINSQDTLNGALKLLAVEIRPESYKASDSSSSYRRSLAVGLFYKFYLSLCDESAISPDVSSAIESIQRPLTSATQTFDTDASMYPVSEAIPKVTAIKQASGEAIYASDFAALSDELFAVFVPATTANADIDQIDASAAMQMPGYHSIITGADLPSEITNTYISPPNQNQPIIAESHVDFAGQPVAIVLADTQDHAEAISRAITVTYKNQSPGVFEMAEAIEKGMFFDNSGDPVVIGDAAAAVASAPRKVTGKVNIGGQYHFYMETQVTRAKPTEDGFQVESATQWQDEVQRSLSFMLGWDCNRFHIETGRVGGAYGGKATNSLITASAATLASYISGKPVRLHCDLERCMETYGCRPAYVADYTVGFDDQGKLQGIIVTYYANCGVSPNDPDVVTGTVSQFGDSGYHCPAWQLNIKWVKTDLASPTWCRSPTSAQMVMIMEVIQEHIANNVGIDPITVKQGNLYVQNQLNLFKEPLTYCNIKKLSEDLLSSAEVTQRQSDITAFNNANKWKKRGIGFSPMKFGLSYEGAQYSAQVSIFHTDGTIILSAGGIDVGQGMHTKLIQVASYILGAPMDLIRVRASDITANPNSAPTGGSLTSELCCKAILESCKILKTRLDAVNEKLNLTEESSWSDKVAKAYQNGVNLTAQYWFANDSEKIIQYNSYGAACTEVELDIITGEFVLRRVDMLYDCGQSINPDIDIGQAEGAFMMGVGFYTSERMVYDSTSGQLVTKNTWEYKPPTSKDIPTVWNITFLKDAPNPSGILSSKASGEPPLCTSSSVVFALKRCIEAFRKESSYFAIDLPATVENVQKLCKTTVADYNI
uniref:abscisic-aldehyde oxidase-like isoform X1 n=2 Tax=Styela clava TaxID=7725 RepID=UPI00193A2518|nr:abscisic-aldehyde oxidase-like isoform X1 [Styela clava]